MDYRAVNLDTLVWAPTRKVLCAHDSCVVTGVKCTSLPAPMIQTPTGRCSVTPNADYRFPGGHVLRMRVPHEFAVWISQVEDCIRRCVPELSNFTCRPCTSGIPAEMRFSIFIEDDIACYDDAGQEMRDDGALIACDGGLVALLIALEGCWVSHASASWGVKWRIVQIKQMAGALPSESLFVY